MEPNQDQITNKNVGTNSLTQPVVNNAETVPVVNVNSDVVSTNAVPNETSENSMMAHGVSAKKSKKTGIVLGFVLLFLIAAGGVGFGVWAMMDGNARIDNLNSQITSLKEQNGELLEQVSGASTDMGGTIINTDTNQNYKNPVIKSLNSDETYFIWLKTSRYFPGNVDEYRTLQIGVSNGSIYACRIFRGSMDDNIVSSGTFMSDCEITGISGEIYNVIEFGEGQDDSDSNIGFIMSDGTIKYFPYIKAMEENDFSVKGTLNVGGYVVNAIDITAGSSNPNIPGGYGSTVFVLKDGTFVKYSKSMLE